VSWKTTRADRGRRPEPRGCARQADAAARPRRAAPPRAPPVPVPQPGLRRELDVGTQPASQRLYGDILTGRFPPPSAPGPRHNLPAALSSFIGRGAEIAEVRHLWANTWMLTLTGAGGCGKSRLALEVAGGLVDGCTDGVWVVEAGPLADPDSVARKVAAVLGVREDPARRRAGKRLRGDTRAGDESQGARSGWRGGMAGAAAVSFPVRRTRWRGATAG
jgi:hypothetical protein